MSSPKSQGERVQLARSRGVVASVASRVASRALNDPRPKNPLVADAAYDADQLEFLVAVDEYRRKYSRKFMNSCDYLRVLKSLGYSKG